MDKNIKPTGRSLQMSVINRPRLVDEVIIRLQDLLSSGKYKGGDRFPPESELGEMLLVSRTTIREAVKVLANNGQLIVQQGRGTFVAHTSPDKEPLEQRMHRASAREIHDIRQMLDTGIARLAARRRTEEDITDMRSHLVERWEAQVQRDLERCVDKDIDFHLAMAMACKNNMLVDLFKVFETGLRESVYRSRKTRADRDYNAIYSSHEKLLKAVEDQDEEAAAAWAVTYLAQVEDD
jgi:DNA-binding FadR family transcriptional regulator